MSRRLRSGDTYRSPSAEGGRGFRYMSPSRSSPHSRAARAGKPGLPPAGCPGFPASTPRSQYPLPDSPCAGQRGADLSRRDNQRRARAARAPLRALRKKGSSPNTGELRATWGPEALRTARLVIRGRHVIAQGNALGAVGHGRAEPCRGEMAFGAPMSPLQGSGDGPPVPGALPQAIEFCPFGATLRGANDPRYWEMNRKCHIQNSLTSGI